jgi:hypothetical protein
LQQWRLLPVKQREHPKKTKQVGPEKSDCPPIFKGKGVDDNCSGILKAEMHRINC